MNETLFSGGESKEKQMAMQPRRSQPRFCLVHKRVQKPRGAHCPCSIFQQVSNYAVGSSCKAITCNPHLRTTAQYLQTDFTNKRFAIQAHNKALLSDGCVRAQWLVTGLYTVTTATASRRNNRTLGRRTNRTVKSVHRKSGWRLYSQN